ncbi:helix-turn-helix domain-containing protein [Aquibacillus sp. 3ASR75-11]|uniref:Helix-turn-helix domain-containing protein n=1 Tax=Terrihalobacillus insolitus TaxID=2950438 RepID=A0A9X3WV95_9BACI|nr:helix-turn-helix domain-containing protein [Terrihalobacillus insolitus]MDC3413547.1 helix-turn-helix domain-containing protein [Terrihalobacillus insolitus]MDC3424696.1 helix-turn-helix domain-containing protein [Terrihalobacillus insolitus]
MFEQLKELFPSLIQAEPHIQLDMERYHWFKTKENEVIGVDKEELSTSERDLLKLFLEPYQVEQLPVTNREHEWIDVLFHNKHHAPTLTTKKLQSFRFIYFRLSKNSVDPVEFREAIHGIYPTKVPIIWENNHEGIIVEEAYNEQEKDISYEQIVDVLMGDFYIKLHFYVGPVLTDLERASDAYKWGKHTFDKLLQYNKKPVTTFVEAVPFLIVDHLDEKNRSKITETVLQETLSDEELLKTIQLFLECGSNTTLAAKKLYMHRNSLQYRVDKFIDKTGIDIRNFNQALTVYLAIMLKNK